MKSPLARYYKIRSDIAFFGFMTLCLTAEPYWLRLMFFVLSIIVTFALAYASHQAEKRNEP